MALPDALADLPGGRALVDWFGRLPRFHDAELLELDIPQGRAGRLVLHSWNRTDAVDPRGRYILDRHAVVTFDLDEVLQVELSDQEMPAIVARLSVTGRDGAHALGWTSACGVEGTITARGVRVGFVPGEPPAAKGSA